MAKDCFLVCVPPPDPSGGLGCLVLPFLIIGGLTYGVGAAWNAAFGPPPKTHETSVSKQGLESKRYSSNSTDSQNWSARSAQEPDVMSEDEARERMNRDRDDWSGYVSDGAVMEGRHEEEDRVRQVAPEGAETSLHDW